MLDKIKYYLSVGTFWVKLNVQSQMEYPAFLIGWFISNAFQFLTGIAAINFVVNTFQTVNGWSFKEIAFLYGLGIVSHSLGIILFIQTWYLEHLVVHGEFDRMKLRPMSVFFQFSVISFNLIGFTDMLPGLIIFIYGAIGIHFQWNFDNIFKIILVITGATLIRGAIYTLSSSIAFWTKRSSEFTSTFADLIHKSLTYPLSVYGEVLQGIFTFFIPIGFICFYPASEFLNKNSGYVFPLPATILSFVIGAVLFALGFFVFNKGLKAYESSGS